MKIIKKLKLLLIINYCYLLFIYCLLISVFSQATDYYISTQGNDISGNGSFANPWHTIDKADDSASPGDYIFARGGIYSNTQSSIHHDGNIGNPICFKAYPGETPVFDGGNAGIQENESIILLYKAHNIIVDGFEVRNSTGRGISISESTNVIIKNCKVYDINIRGIGCNGFNISIISNETYNCCMTNKNGAFGSGGWPAAINSSKIWASGDMSSNIVIAGNYVHNNWGEGIIALEAQNIKVENNYVKDCYSCLIYLDGSCNVSIEKNYICVTTNLYNRSDNGNKANGFLLAVETSDSLPLTNVIIANNLVVNTKKGVGYWNDSYNSSSNNFYSNLKLCYNTFVSNDYVINMDESPFDSTNNFFQNNIVVGGILNLPDSNFWTFSHNCWSEGVPGQVQEPNSFASNPLFVLPIIGGEPEGYKVSNISPVIDKGMPITELFEDYWGTIRSEITPTIGFYEQAPEPGFLLFMICQLLIIKWRKQ